MCTLVCNYSLFFFSREVILYNTGFVNNYNNAIECMKNSREDEKFAKFLEEKMAESTSLDLQSVNF